MTKAFSSTMNQSTGTSTDSGADTMYSVSPNSKSGTGPNENTVLKNNNQTYFAEERIKIPDTVEVSF